MWQMFISAAVWEAPSSFSPLLYPEQDKKIKGTFIESYTKMCTNSKYINIIIVYKWTN